jgi:NTE family protein
VTQLPGQVVLVLQGGGALGAYQAGVYEAMHEAAIEPEWVIGTSIGAITGAIIAGNAPAERLPRLRDFWKRVEIRSPFANWDAVVRGIPAMYAPRALAWAGVGAHLGLDHASYYVTEPLRATLEPLVDFGIVNAKDTARLTIGAVHVTKGSMRYFDSRDEALSLEHVMASGALPPGFPAIRIGGEAYWDAGVYSNTPIEAVFDDKPRKSSLIFGVNVWQPSGPEPESIWQVMGRQKDIQYASRDDSHVERQKQIHHMRRIIRELAKNLPAEKQRDCQHLAAWGCHTTMHLVRLLAPALDSEDFLKDIDFSAAGIERRWRAGLDDARRMIEGAPWQAPADPMAGVVVHELSARTVRA